MMKMKRVLGLLLTLAMLCMGVCAWAEGAYTLTLDLNGGSVKAGETVNTSVSFNSGDALTLPSESAITPPEGKKLYRWWVTFGTEEEGWSEEFAAGDSLPSPPFNITAKAEWIDENAQEFTFSFDLGTSNIISGTMPSAPVIEGTTEYLPDPMNHSAITIAQGKTFVKWMCVDPDTDTEIKDYLTTDAIVVSGNMHFVAVWADAPIYTITFAPGAKDATGEMASTSETEGRMYTLPACGFTRPGYTFAGWGGTNGEQTLAVQPAGHKIRVEGNINLVAKWEKDPSYASLILAMNDGTDTVYEIRKADGSAFPLDLPASFTREGYTFARWNTAADDSGTPYNAAGTMELSEDLTLYAVWQEEAQPEPEPETVTFTFDKNAEDAEGSMEPQTENKGSTVNLTPNTFTRPGYRFAYWSYTADGSSCATDKATITFDESRTLYAIWVEDNITVTFHKNDGTDETDTQTLRRGVTMNLKTGVFAREDAAFQGWATSADGSMAYGEGEAVTLTADNTDLYAVWQVNEQPPEETTYTITYYAGDHGTGASWSEEIAAVEHVMIGHAQGFSPAESKYEFVGWMINGGAYNNQQFLLSEGEPRINLTADISATAIWAVKKVQIKYVSNGVTKSAPQQDYESMHTVLTYDNAALGFEKPDGMEFVKWVLVFNTPEGKIYGDEFEPDMMLPAHGETFEAVWVAENAAEHTFTIATTTGGTVTGPDEMTEKEGSYFKLPPQDNLEPDDGYEFACFKVTGEGYDGTKEYAAAELIEVTGPATVTAYWTYVGGSEPEPDPKTFTITYKANGGVGEDKTQSFTEGVAVMLEANTFTRAGYTFAGWATSENGEKVYDDQQTNVTFEGNTTLYAVWTYIPKTYTITYKANGGEGEEKTQSFTEGAAVTLEANTFTREGYTFAGWATSETGAKVYENGQANVSLDASTTLYAVWTAKPTYTVTFSKNAEDAIGTMADQTFVEGEFQNLTANAFTRPGYTFAGWNTQADGSGTDCADGVSMQISANTTLYAQWTQETYTITFSAGTGSGSKPAMTGLTYGEQIPLGLEGIAAPKDYKFAYWQDEKGNQYSPANPYTVTGNATLTAIWTPETEGSITYHLGYEPSMTLTITGAYKEKHTLLDPRDSEDNAKLQFIAPSGKKFSHWEIVRSDGNDGWIAMDTIDAGGVMTLGGHLNVRAVWIDLSDFVVSFAPGNGGTGSEPAKTVKENSTYVLPQLSETGISPVRGKTFKAWSVGGVETAPGASVIVTSNVTVTAVWSDLGLYTVSFNAAGAAGTMNAVTVYDGETYTLPACGFAAPTGHHFEGWHVGGEFKQPGETIIISGSVTATAQWTPNVHTISFSANGGSGTMADVTKNYGETYTLPENGFAAADSDHVFDCWMVNGVEKFPGDTITVTGDVSVAASWEKGILTMTFVSGEGCKGGAAVTTTVNVNYGSAYTLPVEAKDIGFEAMLGRKFGYWLDASGAKVTSVARVRHDMTFTGFWGEAIIVETEAISADTVTEKLAEKGIDTPAKIVEKLEEKVTEDLTAKGYTEAQVEHVDVLVQVWDDTKNSGQGGYVEATEAVMNQIIQEQGYLPVAVPLTGNAPTGAAAQNYDFTVLHMFTHGDKAGQIEELEAKDVGTDSVTVHFTGLSPVTLVWKEKVYDNAIAALPETGDPSSLIGWVTLLGASGIGLKIRRKKK